MDTAQLKKVYKETIAPALQKQFNYSSSMQVPVLKKIVINQGLGDATQDKKIVDVAINEISAITGQKAVATYSKKDIANFKLRKKMPIGVMVTLRGDNKYVIHTQLYVLEGDTFGVFTKESICFDELVENTRIEQQQHPLLRLRILISEEAFAGGV